MFCYVFDFKYFCLNYLPLEFSQNFPSTKNSDFTLSNISKAKAIIVLTKIMS